MKRLSILIFSFFNLLIFTSCEDFFDQESDHVIYSEQDHLANWSDSVYSVMGIFNKLQVIADRTILLGEVRGDLVTLTNDASADLREMANFNMSGDNQYNQPRDYYAIINNCNYFLANVKKELKNNRNQYIFMREYAVVKSIRAWVYLQLALNYGSVPFVIDPILTKEESERDYPRYDLASICDYFLNDLADIPERYETEFPTYNVVRGNDSRMFFFPLNIVRGDLALYLACTKGADAGKSDFEKAAGWYFKYINSRNGLNSIYPTDTRRVEWRIGSIDWNRPEDEFRSIFSSEGYSDNAELITMIPGDSARAEGYYSELRNLFNSTEQNDYKYCITPSTRIAELSLAQVNACLASNGRSVSYAPNDLSQHRSGDLRLSSVWDDDSWMIDVNTGTRTQLQTIRKYTTKNVHIYRRQMIYLRLAEALNWAGMPRLAYKILETGLSDELLRDEVYPYLSSSDSLWVATNFNLNTKYEVLTAQDVANRNSTPNMQGIHSRGSGWTPLNDYYTLVDESENGYVMQPDSTWAFSQTHYDQIKARQQQYVDSLIINESALEFAFEGTRYYDIMRYAMRQADPGQAMEQFILARRGDANRNIVRGELKNSLLQRSNWYLNWNGKLGLGVK